MNHELRWETRLAGWVCTPVRNPARSRRRFVLFQKHEIQILSYRTEENPEENENENNLAFLQHFLTRTRRKRSGGKHKAPPGHHAQTPTFYIPKTHSSYQKRPPRAGRGNERRVSGRVYKNGTFIATERSCTWRHRVTTDEKQVLAQQAALGGSRCGNNSSAQPVRPLLQIRNTPKNMKKSRHSATHWKQGVTVHFFCVFFVCFSLFFSFFFPRFYCRAYVYSRKNVPVATYN